MGRFARSINEVLPALGVIVAVLSGQTATDTHAAETTGAPSPDARSDDPGRLQRGRELFSSYGCGMCHTLTDAGAFGDTGPSFDGDSNLTKDFLVDRTTQGQAAMPSYRSLLSAGDIDAIASYVMQVKLK